MLFVKCGFYDGRLVRKLKSRKKTKPRLLKPKRKEVKEAAEAKKAEKKAAKKKDSKRTNDSDFCLIKHLHECFLIFIDLLF